VKDPEKRRAIADLIPDQPFIRSAPAFLIFLASGRRLPEISKLRGKPFPNDHLDQFFNAAVDSALTLATFIRAAEAAGLGCCPISVIRDHSARVSEMLSLPSRVIPIAGIMPRLAGGERPYQPAAAAVLHASSRHLRRGRSGGPDRGLRPPPRRDPLV